MADVPGYFTDAGRRRSSSSGLFVCLQPVRMTDTRPGYPSPPARPQAKIAHRQSTAVHRHPAGIPADAGAALLNVTTPTPATRGFVTVYPADPMPQASNLNLERAGQTIPNAVVATLSAAASASTPSRAPTSWSTPRATSPPDARWGRGVAEARPRLPPRMLERPAASRRPSKEGAFMPGSYLVAGARTPIGKLSGALGLRSAADLGGVAIAAALERAGVPARRRLRRDGPGHPRRRGRACRRARPRPRAACR